MDYKNKKLNSNKIFYQIYNQLMTKITIGARGSKLSLAYVAKVKELLIKNNDELKEENLNFKAIKTSGDLNLNKKFLK